jgi:hypothetical protein
MGTDLTTQNSAEVDALLAQQDAEFDSDTFTVPIMKVGQALTKEVQDGEAEPGDFINTLTGEAYGSKIGLIISYYNKGRFVADGNGNARSAFTDTIPESWADFVGAENVGVRFDEYSEAEERFKQDVNDGIRDWGHGPKVSTTHNFTGFAVVPGAEGEDDALEPVRLSLKRGDMDAVRKIITIKKAILRNAPFWDVVFDLSTERKPWAKGSSYVVKVKNGRATAPVEKTQAAELAVALMRGSVVDNAATADAPPPAPEKTTGLSV